MANFCGKCGAQLDARTGLCPRCNAQKARKKKIIYLAGVGICVAVAATMLWMLWENRNGAPVIPETTDATISVAQPSTEPRNIPSGQPSAEEAAPGETVPVIPGDPECDGIVTDAFYKSIYLDYPGIYSNFEGTYTCHYHIPRINLELPGIDRVNQKIYDELYYGILEKDVLSKGNDPLLSQMAYFYSAKGDILSILVCVYDRHSAEYFDDHQYYAYNISMATGNQLSSEEMAAAFGMTFQNFKSKARQEMKTKSDYFYLNNGAGVYMDDYYAKCLDFTLSEDNFSKSQIYIDPASGDLCIAARIAHVDGNNTQEYTFNITGTDEPVDPAEYRDISQAWGDIAETTPKTIFELQKNDYAYVDASSTYDGDRVSHLATNLIDGDLGTNWAEGVDGNGIGEYVQFAFQKEQTITGFRICSGNHATDRYHPDRYYVGNARPKMIKLTFEDGSSEEFSILDVKEELSFQLAKPVTTKTVRLTIQSVYEGSSWEDTVISEIVFLAAK